MKFRIEVQWPSKDVLPMVAVFDTAAAAISEYRRLAKPGIERIAIHAYDNNGSTKISVGWIEKIFYAERVAPKRPKHRARKVIASALLGMVASALPNGFGDFGVVSGYDAGRPNLPAKLLGAFWA